MHRSVISLLFLTLGLLGTSSGQTPTNSAEVPANLRDDQLIAWCIVPFDAKNRSPAERAEMLKRLGLGRVAYDWRAKHVADFEEEIRQYKKHGIEYFAFWGAHEAAFELFEKYELRPQIWQTLSSPTDKSQAQRVRAAAEQILPLVKRTGELDCKLGLYNHGGWGGEPANLVAVCRYLRKNHQADHVGIVYNLHHGHGHIDDFAEAIEQMLPYLLCVNLNGMTRDGDQHGQKILPLGEGEFDVQLLTQLNQSGYAGPVGIIGHTQDDVEQRLRDNLDGLHWILPQLGGKPAGPKPRFRTFSPEQSSAAKNPVAAGVLLEGDARFRRPPITAECRATLADARTYNILIASDAKSSGDHWELFTSPGDGFLTAYLPGCLPDHVRSRTKICDGKPHNIAMIYLASRVQLFVDGIRVADQSIERTARAGAAGQLAIGRLVEGGLGCRGKIDWVKISQGSRDLGGQTISKPTKDEKTILFWKPKIDASGMNESPSQAIESKKRVAELLQRARKGANFSRGLLAFASAKSACLSCHRIGEHGGNVGPELTQIGKQRTPEQIVASILWPGRDVKSEYVTHVVVDDSGQTHQGYRVSEDDAQLVLRDPSSDPPKQIKIPVDEIELRREIGTLMPNNLAASMSESDLVDLIGMLCSLGTDDRLLEDDVDSMLSHAQMHAHGPTEFPLVAKPLRPEIRPSWIHPINRDRVYDFYAKQADYFRQAASAPALLTEYPGLDGGTLGHWGNQNDTFWADERWNQTDLGSLISGVFRGRSVVPRAVCVRLGEDGKLATCFNPETLSYEQVWRGGFVKFSQHRHGFLAGLKPDGNVIDYPGSGEPGVPFRYNGFYRVGKQVIFSYHVGADEILDAPTVRNGQFVRRVAARELHPLADRIQDPPAQWPQTIETNIRIGNDQPYAIDQIELPLQNPWNVLLFCGDHAFLPDGSALVCMMQGDVWRVSQFQYPSTKAVWKRFASGLHHPLGMVVDQDGIFVLGRDQITRLHDLNDDGEADFYECFSNAYQTSPAGHDFICGLDRDSDGNFYLASGNQGLVRVSADGRTAETIATGFRNPDGLGCLPGGVVTVPCSEGSWTPASMICAVKTDAETLRRRSGEAIQHFGYRGPRGHRVPDLPLVYLPRGLDNSSGGQTVVDSGRWGPLDGQLIHFSFGMGTHFMVLRDEVAGQMQGAVVPLPGEFRSGAHRGKFHPGDGQLYVTGMQGWGSYTPDDGCFQRVRYTGQPVQLPIRFRAHENGVAITFAEPLDASVVTDRQNHFAQAWNYRYSAAYGSPEMSTRHPGMRGHDVLTIRQVHLLADGRTMFLEMPELQPVNQLHLRLQFSPGKFQDLFCTIHRLAAPLKELPDYQPASKSIAPHPILADLAMATRSVPNPYREAIKNARAVRVEVGTNLSYQTRSFRARAGEPIALTLVNPDVVPHNWALGKPGTLERIGRLSDRLISDPEASLRHYIPSTSDVLAHTDVVLPKGEFTIYFRAPEQPGRYPYLCTFPGHWKVMNGVMIVHPIRSE